MKKLFLTFLAALLLTGCFGEATFDASSEEAMKASSQKMAEKLPADQTAEFGKAIMFYMMGGSFDMGDTSRPEISDLDGLTADQIIIKYRERLAADKEKRAELQAIKDKQTEDKREIRRLKEEAQALLEKQKFDEALNTYQSIADIPDGADEAKAGILEATEQLKLFEEKQAYIKDITVTEFTSKRVSTYKGDTPGIRVALKNNGDRSLDKVEITVYYQDEQGNTIYEDSFLPVYAGGFDSGKPLKPGYVDEMKQNSYFTIDSALSDWAEGQATMKITNIEFSE